MNYRLAQIGVIAAAFLGYWALLVYCEVWKPAPLGLFLSFDDSRVIVVDTVAGGPAQRAGLRAGDRIASADGHPIGGRLDWMTVEANLDFGRATQLSADRDGAVFAAPITLEPSSWQSWRSQHGPALLAVRLIQLVTLLLALMVAARRSRDSTAIVGAAFLATIGVFSLTLPYRFASVWRALPAPANLLLWIPFMSSVAIAAWGFSFFAIFPRVRFRTPLAWCAVWIPLVPGLVGQGIFGYHTIVLGQPAPPLPPWTQSLVVVGVAYFVAGLTALVLNYRRLGDVNERRRVRVVMLGSLIGAMAGMPVVLSYWRTSTNNLDQSFLSSPFATLGSFLFLAMPLSFAYAMLRHRLFDISVMIRQGLRYALARRALLALVPVLLVFLGVDLVAHGDEPVIEVLRSRLWMYVSLAALAFVARRRRQGWLDSLDRRFFRERLQCAAAAAGSGRGCAAGGESRTGGADGCLADRAGPPSPVRRVAPARRRRPPLSHGGRFAYRRRAWRAERGQQAPGSRPSAWQAARYRRVGNRLARQENAGRRYPFDAGGRHRSRRAGSFEQRRRG